MKNSIKIIILVAVLILVVSGAFIAYNVYNKNADIYEKTITQTQEYAKMSDFSFFDINNKEMKLSDFSGKAIVVNFWATWCPSCVSELGNFQNAYDSHKDDIQFVMLNITDGQRETEKSVKEFISENKYTFPVFMDKRLEGTKTYGTYTIPQTLFIDKDGNIIYTHTGAMTLHDLEANIKAIK